jgi:WD40 repeat protein
LLDAGAPVKAIALNNDGRAVAGATDDGRIGVWDTTGEKIATLQGHEGQVTALAFSPDGRRLASAGADGTAKIWDILRQREARTFGHKGPVTSVSFSPDGSRLATGSDDKVVSVWDLTGKGAFREYRGHKRPARAVVFSPDGKRLVSTSREVRLWSTAADTRAEKLDGLPEDASAAAFSHDGAALAVAAVNEVGLWNLPQGRRQQAVRVPGAKFALTFTANGRCLAVSVSNGPAGEVKLWDLANPDPLVSLSAGGVLRAVAVTHSAEFIAAAGDDGRISVWRKDPGYLADSGHRD